MAHWDEERDRRWVELLRTSEIKHPEIKSVTDAFEQTGDVVHLAAALDILRGAWRKEDLERRQGRKS